MCHPISCCDGKKLTHSWPQRGRETDRTRHGREVRNRKQKSEGEEARVHEDTHQYFTMCSPFKASFVIVIAPFT